MEPAAEQVGQEAAAILSEGKGPRDSRQLSTPRTFMVAEGRTQPTVAPLRPSILRTVLPQRSTAMSFLFQFSDLFQPPKPPKGGEEAKIGGKRWADIN